MIVDATPPHSLRGLTIPKLYQCLRRQQKRTLNNILNRDKNSIQQISILPFKSLASLTNDTRHTRKPHQKISYQHTPSPYAAKIKKPIAKSKIRRAESKVASSRVERQTQLINYRIRLQSLSMEDAVDWMMQMSHSLKVTKNAYFRSVLILLRACKLEPSLKCGPKFREYICAALSIGWKFEYSPSKALQQICKRNSGYCSKGQIIQAEGHLLNLLAWQVPVQLMLEEMLNRLLTAGIAALMPPHRVRDRPIFAPAGWQEEKFRAFQLSKKLEIEIVYLVDFLLLMRAEKWLMNVNFTEPILIALYTVLSITMGDLALDQFILWPSFESFVLTHCPEQDLSLLHDQITQCLSEYNVSEVLARIPLCLDFQTLGRRRYEQLYIRQTNLF